MAPRSNQMYITRKTPFSRAKIFHPPSALLHATARYSMERRKDDPSRTKLSELLTGGIRLPALQEMDRGNPKFSDYLGRVRESFVGQLALAARDHSNIHAFLNAHKYVIIDGQGHITGTNTRFFGMGNLRIPTKDIKWLINRLE